jgi:hypothetical protein
LATTPEEIIKRIWSRVRTKHLFPELPIPKVSEGEGNVALEMKSKQITINTAFSDKIAQKMDMEDVVEALLDHGISHYTYCPWDFHTHLRLFTEAKRVIKDKERAKRAAGLFMDVVADTYCVKRRKTPLPDLYKHLEGGKVEEVITSLYQRIWGVDLRAKEDEEVVRRLARIPYLDKKQWDKSIQKFTRVIKALLELQEEQDRQEDSQANPMGEHGLDGYTLEEIDRGLRDFANQNVGLKEFKETFEDFKDELKEVGYGMEGGMGRGEGSPLDADLIYYMKLAENYSIPIKKVPMEKRGFLNPHSHSPWEIGRPFQDVDVWTSFGKIMPGITQTWNKIEGSTFGEKESVPDCIIIIDSSGSMTNPRKNLSYAVLGAACASDAYLRNDAQVAVYNFSDAPMGGKAILDFTSNRTKIYQVLCKYFGGGTALNLNELDPLLEASKKPDIFIITDMKITNLGKVIGYLNTIDNRITAVYIGENTYALRFREAMEGKKNVSFYNVTKKEDIPKIVLGKIREYFRGNL